MKFLLIVLIIRLVVSWLTGRNDTDETGGAEMMDRDVRHPAEFELR